MGTPTGECFCSFCHLLFFICIILLLLFFSPHSHADDLSQTHTPSLTCSRHALSHTHALSLSLLLTLQIAIYQITDMDLCNKVLSLHNNGVKVSLIVSARIVSYPDYKKAQQCYETLYDKGVGIRKALTKFSFAHQKYWIIDNTDVHLSTGEQVPCTCIIL